MNISCISLKLIIINKLFVYILQVYNGTNLLTDICAKPKKPKLFGTALLSHLFTDEEMRVGCVEPRDRNSKKSLDPVRVDLIKSKYFLL